MGQPTPARPEKVALGVVTIVATVFTMSFGDALVKHVSADFTMWQIYVLRSLVAIPILMVLLLLGGGSAALRPKAIGWALVRSMLLVMMWIAFYVALPALSLSLVAAAYYTAPLFITLFSALLIREPVGARRWVGILAGFIGVLVILRPGTDAFSWLTLLPILSAVLYGLAAIITRTRCSQETPFMLSLALNVSFLGVGAIGTVAIQLWRPFATAATAFPFLLGDWAAMGGREWLIVALLAVLIVAISAGVAKAYQSGPPAIIAAFDYSYLVFAVLWGLVFFGETPDAATVAGMALIAGAGLLAVAQARTLGATRAASVS